MLLNLEVAHSKVAASCPLRLCPEAVVYFYPTKGSLGKCITLTVLLIRKVYFFQKEYWMSFWEKNGGEAGVVSS